MPFNLALISWILNLLLLSNYFGYIRAFCPSLCRCSDGLLHKKLGANSNAISVNCSRANLTNFPILLNPRTKSLILTQNRLSSLTLDELSIYPDLEHLDLSFNQLMAIEQGAFFRLQKLKVLRLNNNLLTSLSIETFAGLAELKFLDLSHNLLGRLATSIFSDLPRLERLNLTKNSIRTISSGAFVNLVSLKEIDLADNDLNHLPTTAFRSVESLRILDLSRNQLDSLGAGSFSFLTRLEILDLSSNRIETIDDNAFANLVNLQQLNLYNNKLRKVPTMNFRHLTELQRLEIGRNDFHEIPTSAFEGLGRLKQLAIEQCPELRSTALNSFSGLYELETLILAENPKLTDIHAASFEQRNSDQSDSDGGKFYEIILLSGAGETPTNPDPNDGGTGIEPLNNNPFFNKLRRVHLHKNNLNSLSPNMLTYDRLFELDLRQNPWRCDCDTKFLGVVLRKMYGTLDSDSSFMVPNGNNGTVSADHLMATCHAPEQLVGRPLTSVQDGEYGYCDSDSDSDWIRTLTLVLSALSVLTIVACLTVRFRWKILQLCYMMKVSSKSDNKYDRGSLASSGGSSHVTGKAPDRYPPSGASRYVLSAPFVELPSDKSIDSKYYSPKICRAITPNNPAMTSINPTLTSPPQAVICEYYFDGDGKPFKTEYRHVAPTSDYYSCGASINSGGYLRVSATPSPHRTYVSTYDRTGSFRIIQTCPVPITEV